jgi:predicted Zn-dependent peptidase
LEHIITDAWKRCNNNCTNYWRKKGIRTNAMTTETDIRYYIIGLEEYTYDMLDYITSICIKPIINKKTFEKEKKAVINELMIHDSNPQNDLYNAINDILYRVEGLKLQDQNKLQINNLNKIKLEDLQNWHKKYYGPGNMLFIISGKFNKNKIIKYLKKRLNKFNVETVIPKYVEIYNQGTIVKYVKNKTMDNTCIQFVFPASIFQRDPESELITLFTYFINTSVTSILFDVLREQRKLIYSTSVDYYISPYGTYLSIELFTNNKNIEQVVTTTIKILKDIRRGKFKTEYLNNVKKAYKTDYNLRKERIDNVTNMYGEQYINQIMNVSDEPILMSNEQIKSNIINVTKTNFLLFLKKMLIFENMKLVYQGKRKVANLQTLVLNKI